VIRLAAVLALSLQVVFAYPADDPKVLQKQGIKRIDQYTDHFRRTGDQTSLLPELQEAQSELKASYDGFLARRDFAAAAWSVIKLGDIERLQTHWDAASRLYTRARDLARQANHSGYQAKALLGLAKREVYGGGNLGAAADYITEAIPLATDSGNKDYLFDAFALAAELEVKRGNVVAAGEYLNRALALEGELQDKALVFYGYFDRADMYQQRGQECDYGRDFDACYRAFELARADYEQALRRAQELGFKHLADQMHEFLQRLDQRERLIKSEERFHRGVSVTAAALFHPKKATDVTVSERFAPGPDEANLALVRIFMQQYPGVMDSSDPRGAYIQGTYEEMSGNSDAALAGYLKAVDLLERDRRNLRDEQNRGTFLEDKIGLYYAPILQLLDRRRHAEAFALMERSRSRAMADLLASRTLALGTPQERELFSESLKLKANIALEQQKLFRLTAGAERAKHAKEISQAEARINKLEAENQKLEERIAKETPRLRELGVSRPVSLENAQRSAKQEGYDLLYYLTLEHAVILWHIGGDDVRVLNVFLPRSEVMSKVAALHESLTDPEHNANPKFDEQTSRELFLFLIQPVLKSIKTHHIIIVPHEDLNYIPFQVLQDPADGAYLGERFQISYAPSATVLAGLKKKPNIAGGWLLAVADPDIEDAKAEVGAIARLYPRRSKVVKDVPTKKEDVKAWVGGYNLVHLSVHGSFDPSDPLLSYLQFGKAQDDGRLTAAEMFGLPLAKDSLVVLSACETGQVKATHANEVLGMVRALLYAGANNLVLSSWKVQSEPTALWMETFYQQAQTKSSSEAARRALLAVKSRPEYRHPFFWGAFLLTGK
jgi:CHAT domain-containing protein